MASTTAEVIATIAFGIFMAILGVISIVQSTRQRAQRRPRGASIFVELDGLFIKLLHIIGVLRMVRRCCGCIISGPTELEALPLSSTYHQNHNTGSRISSTSTDTTYASASTPHRSSYSMSGSTVASDSPTGPAIPPASDPSTQDAEAGLMACIGSHL